MEFFGGATTDSLGDGLFNFATTGFPLDFGAVQTTASPFGDGDLFFNPVRKISKTIFNEKFRLHNPRLCSPRLRQSRC